MKQREMWHERRIRRGGKKGKKVGGGRGKGKDEVGSLLTSFSRGCKGNRL